MNTYSIKYNELEGRLDPSAYHPIRRSIIKKIKSLNCDVLPLNEVATFKRNIVTRASENMPYFGLENIESNTGIASDVEQGKEFSSAFSFNAGNILFPKLRPYLNKVHLATAKGVCSTEFHILEANRCSSYYLFAFLNSDLVVNQTSYLMTGNTLPRLQTKDIEGLLIPILPEPKQKQIEDLLKKTYKTQETKLKQADELLGSIDDFIKQQLGINFPNANKRLVFLVSNTAVKGSKLAPNFYANSKDSSKSKNYPEKKLKDVAILQKGRSITKKNIKKGDYPVIAGGQTSPYSIDKFNYKGNIVTVSASGAYSGYVWYHDYPIFASDCIVVKSQKEQGVSTHFIYLVMKAKQQFVYHMQQGAGQPHVYAEDLGSLNIPLPPLETQEKISNEIKEKYQQIEQLKKEASELLIKAKKKIETMILN